METPVQEYQRLVPDQSQVNITTFICRGVVESNNDPYRMGRVQVRIPYLHGIPKVTETSIPSNKLPWAPICSLSAGQGKGTVLTPMIGDAVFVGFEDGRKDKPVVLGCCYSTGVENGAKFTGSTSDMFKHVEGIKKIRTEKSDIPDQSRLGDSTQVLYKSVKGGQISFEDKDCYETVRLIDRIGQIIEMGTDSPSETQTRPKGDRSRKNELPKEGMYSKGYIHLHSAAQHGRDPGMHITEDYVQAVNGTSLFSMDQDHVILSNFGGEILSTRNRPEGRVDENGQEIDSESTAESMDKETVSNVVSTSQAVGSDVGNIASQTANIQSQASAISAASSAIASKATSGEDSATNAKNKQAASQLSSRASAIQANATAIAKGNTIITGCFGGNELSDNDTLSTVSGVVEANSQIMEVVNTISKVQTSIANITKLAEGIGNISLPNAEELAGTIKNSVSNIKNSISNINSSVSNIAKATSTVSSLLSSKKCCILDFIGDQIILKNSGCFIRMKKDVMTIQANKLIIMKAPQIHLNP